MFYGLVEGCQLPEEKTVLSFRVNNEGLTLHANAGIPTNLAKSNTVYNSCHNTHLDHPQNPNFVYRNLIEAAEEDHAVPSVWLRKVSEVISRRQPPNHYPSSIHHLLSTADRRSKILRITTGNEFIFVSPFRNFPIFPYILILSHV
jgi:hypothetical protein